MTPTRPLNPDALGPMYEALKDMLDAIADNAVSINGPLVRAALDEDHWWPWEHEWVNRALAALALAEKGEAS